MNLPGSPTSSYLADDAASTCNLINPSPPTNALVNPIPTEQEDETPYHIGQELATKLQKVQGKQQKYFCSKNGKTLQKLPEIDHKTTTRTENGLISVSSFYPFYFQSQAIQPQIQVLQHHQSHLAHNSSITKTTTTMSLKLKKIRLR